MRLPVPILVVGTVVIVVAAGIYFLAGAGNEPETHPATPAPTPAPVQRDTGPAANTPTASTPPTPDHSTASTPQPAPAAPAPDPRLVAPPTQLKGSDTEVQKALALISPKLTKWLIPDEQIRKWVLTIDLVADGKLPRRYRPLDYPMKPFAVDKDGKRLVASDKNFDRLTPLIDTLESLDVQLLAKYYREWSPLLEKAYREQGKSGTFHDRLMTALGKIILVAPLPNDDATLVRPNVLYTYDDQRLEQASDIEKLCWRMGVDNTLDLQDFARELRSAIENPD